MPRTVVDSIFRIGRLFPSAMRDIFVKRVSAVAARYWRASLLVAAGVAGLAAAATGLMEPIERFARGVEWSLLSRPASGRLHIVEIDGRSMAEIDRWPWPRSNYVAAIDRLHAAGVAQIAFDVDFSARSDPRQDGALAAALARAGGSVVLPTFRQTSGGRRQGWTD